MEKDLAIIGASYLQLPLIRKAKEMGYTTHVFAWAANDAGEKEADCFYPVSITEAERITEICREIGICGVCSIATDLGNYTVNYIADQLGLPGNSMDCTRKSTNKYLMRNAFRENGDPCPRYCLADEQTDFAALDLAYPVIVKPTDRSGSRGINKLENPEGLKKAVHRAVSESFEKKALIEEYVTGTEYSVEAVSFKGVHHILAMTLKYTTGAPHFIETGHLEPAPVSEETYRRAAGVVTHALDTLGVTNSASHSEIKIDEKGDIRIIEIGSRMGGDCIGSDLVRCSTGIDFVRAVIQVACGEEPDLKSLGEGFPVSSRFVFCREDLDEMNRIRRENPESFLKLVYLREEMLGKAADSSGRAGCYILKCAGR